MARSSALEIELSRDKLEFVKEKVATGEYSSESDLIEQGIAALQDRDASFEEWVRERAVPAYERLLADPSRGMTLEQVRANLAGNRHTAQEKR